MKFNNIKGLDFFDKGYIYFCVDVIDIGFEFECLKGFGMIFFELELINVGYVIIIYGCDFEGNFIEI